MSITRRGFVTGCSSAVAAFAGTNFNTLAFGDPEGDNDNILVSVFLRGGMDGLNLIMPRSGADRGFYETARPDLAVPVSGTNASLGLGSGLGIHPAVNTVPNGSSPPGSLWDIYQDGKLSLIVAAGMHEDNRSHFDSMSFMELGTPGTLVTPTGWLTRHLQSTSAIPDEVIMPALAVGNIQQTSLRGSTEAVNMTNPDSFSLNVGPSQYRDTWRIALRNLYRASGDWLQTSGSRALDAIDIIQLNSDGGYTPANGAVYPNGSLGDHFETIARMIKLDLGLRVATVDFGGWDTHNGQGDDGGGYFAGHLGQLAHALAAFYTDLDGAGSQDYASKVTIVVMSEFGRRLRQNADRGSDHGHGNMMMVLSGAATGGVHGTWPGLSNEQLFDGADLEVTTDYRRVLSEILIRRMGNPNLGAIFPGYSGYAPLGVVSGPDLPPIYGPELFADGFESGNLSGWSGSV
ncbi:MAG: DUF1501 domain-containing protein [Acidobacteriota bacterium]